jgi:hypothetical protein
MKEREFSVELPHALAAIPDEMPIGVLTTY